MRHGIIRACAACLAVFALLFTWAGSAAADPVISQTDDTLSVTDDAVSFGLDDFSRLQTGSNRSVDDVYYGYVYAMGQGEQGKNSLVAVALTDQVVVYAPADICKQAGFDLKDEADQKAIVALLTTADDEVANGGTPLSALDVPYAFTSEGTYQAGDVTVSFGVEVKDGYYYTTVNAASKEASRQASLFCDTAQLLPADQIQVVESTFFTELGAFFAKLDMRPLWVSLKTAGVAMVFIFILGLLAAWRSMHVKSRWKSVLDSIFTIPMVLPPTVCGFILLLIFGKSTDFGRFLIDHGISLVFTWEAAVIAAVVVGFPLMYRTVLGAFEALDTNMLDAARTLGWSETRIFRKLMLPLAWPSIAAGTVLAFARAMGEFGATLFFAGNYAGVTQTIPIAIYFNWMGGSTDVALFWVIVVIIFSFIVILFINLWSRHTTKYRRQEVIEDGSER